LPRRAKRGEEQINNFNNICVSAAIACQTIYFGGRIANTVIGFEHLKKLSRRSSSKIVLLVIDGVGGLPHPKTGKTELESAKKPNLDQVAKESLCGLIDPIGPGITPGSAPGHLAIFGYDPLKYNVGRGIIEALGIALELKPGDIAARGNFCTIDEKGTIIDRRAGRISTEKNAELCQLLNKINVNGAELLVTPVKEHRFVLILRGEDLSPELADSDPQQVGLAPKKIESLSPEARRTAEIVNEFALQTKSQLRNEASANMVLLRGFSQRPDIPSMTELYKLKPAAIAIYPMYRGLASLVGMELLPAGNSITEQLESLHHYYADYDFFFIHFKATDSRGEDGDFAAKARAIEEVDGALPQLLKLNPDVIVITGDHSTPAAIAAHSWHPVPFMLHSKWCFPDNVAEFSERACLEGGLGRFPAVEIMSLAMANALKLDKFAA
jgi:2,3-bisphosphoglycerate-independent phosphoglycerate mutase